MKKGWFIKRKKFSQLEISSRKSRSRDISRCKLRSCVIGRESRSPVASQDLAL